MINICIYIGSKSGQSVRNVCNITDGQSLTAPIRV